MRNISDIIKDLCTEHGISSAELEREIGISNGLIGKWGSVKPSIDKIKTIADYFDVSIDYIMGRTLIRDTVDKTLSDPDLIVIQRLRDNMSTKNKERMMRMIEIQFEEDLPKDK